MATLRLPLPCALAAARAAGALTRRRGGGGTSVPGMVLLALRDDAVGELARRLPRGSALISATNGKTTTAALAAGVLEAAGVTLVHNSAGANMEGGIASTLLEATRAGGIDGELGCFEVDEAWLGQLVERIRPRVVLLGNLFRDQLDRYGELETLAGRWSSTVAGGAGADARLVLNADDPLVADLGRDRPGVSYFGVEDDSVRMPTMAHAADAKHCRRCGAPYVFDAIYLGHLGRYHCESCGQSRPAPTLAAREIELHGAERASFTLASAEGDARVELALPGLYNVYNALGAAALCVELGVPLGSIAAALGGSRAAFGRAEAVSIGGRPARIMLVKNPAGANEVLRTLSLARGRHELLLVLNDRIADGRDVSWIWDADFELLAGAVARVTCAGTRAPEMALRLKYAGVAEEAMEVVADVGGALSAALGASERASERSGAWMSAARPAPPPLFILPTYTAMIELRALLVERGVASERWAA
ncbi:MAG: MurT ligase domain-containing protein [Solirubrobacteraceae bacterium]